jgi:exonuclease SbcC
MRIRSVTAHSFGPLQNETLELAEGMTVIFGANESAKSSWHAAIYAAVCGRRRGRGRSRTDEQHFADLHKPWDSDAWLVSAQLDLDDGRRIEMWHDLAGRVDCRAKDLIVGTDVSSEVISDGAPDGSRWLGLDRESFAATACVEQAHLLRVLEDADGLQEHLQRAAATAGTDATATAALECLDEFAREHVGLERANSTKPLQRALNAVTRASAGLRQRQAEHQEYVARVEDVETLRAEAASKTEVLHAYEAAAAAAAAAQLRTKAGRAAELYAVYRDTAPSSRAEDDALAQQASTALAAWRSQPQAESVPDRSSADIRAELDSLPPVPVGDLVPHPTVVEARNEVSRVDAWLDQHARSRPPVEVQVPQVGATDAELIDLAHTLESPPPHPRPSSGRHTTARSGAESGAIIGAGVTLAVVGGVLVAINSTLGVIVAAVGIIIAGIGLVRRQSSPHAVDTAADSAKRRQRAMDRCAELGISPDPQTLRAVTVARAQAAGLAEQRTQWEHQASELASATTAVCARLAAALQARGVAPAGVQRELVLQAADQYQTDCLRWSEQAGRATRRDVLAEQLAAVAAAEERAARDAQERTDASRALLEAARTCGVAMDAPEHAFAALNDWLTQRAAQLDEASHAEREWAELKALLAGGTLADLQRAAAAAHDRAEQLASVNQAGVASVDSATAADALPAVREQAAAAESRAATAEGALKQLATSVGSVAEAEEAAEQASAELTRVRELADTLATTRRFLEDAQERVHREIAPVLAATVKRDLPALTDGRYTDVIVDPNTLKVQVCGPNRRWRDAARLSYGTAEQVYLLLRIALADHLTRGHDTCPLLLDDVTVHADAERTREILELLLHVADSRQVVMFTQEEQVASWARERLLDPRHANRSLPVVTVT